MSLVNTTVHRILIEAPLTPVQGRRFQPTGFADLGAATYEIPDGPRMLLVESAQSMANRLEQVCIGDDRVSLAPELDGLPYVEVRLTGESSARTSSLNEAHRLNSPFILKAEGFERTFREAVNYEEGKAVDWPSVARGVFKLDPNSLVHGLFMSNFEDGRIRLQRALTGFIEATDVMEANSGGVKNNPIDPSGRRLRVTGYEKDVYSNVPYHRTEYVASDIRACFAIDVELLRSYQLGPAATTLLVALALYKVRSFLEGGMRLRTACDFKLAGGVSIDSPAGESLPSRDELLATVRDAIGECESMFASPRITKLTATVARKKDDKSKAGRAADSPEVDTDDDDDANAE